ncbi:MAG TPA: hypothetical protein VIF86_01805, partial [Methylobacter sp.]
MNTVKLWLLVFWWMIILHKSFQKLTVGNKRAWLTIFRYRIHDDGWLNYLGVIAIIIAAVF